MVNNSLTKSNYKTLLADLSSILIQGQQSALNAVNEIRLKTYWQMGKRLAKAKEFADSTQASTLFGHLANDLNMEPSLLYRIHQFYRLWPKAVPTLKEANILSWSHFVELLSIPDGKERDFYFKQASTEGWSRDILRKAIQKDLYQISKSPKKLRDKSLLKRPDDALHVYKAVVEKVVDGDTLLVRIDLGFDVWVSQRTRFRGINTAEIIRNGVPTPKRGPFGAGEAPDRAEQAKKFVEEKLSDLEFVVIKTYKTDMYGRYVVDLFYHPILDKKENVYEEGFFLNAQLLTKGLADFVP